MKNKQNFIYIHKNGFSDYIQNKVFHYEHAQSQFGYYICVYHECNLLYLSFIDKNDLTTHIDNFKSQFKNASGFKEKMVNDFFDEKLNIKHQTANLIFFGTDFQLNVWQSLACVPFGKQISYSFLAENIGQPKANRAVANAIGENPISYFMPCHRIVRKDGGLGGYRWGIETKKNILNFESI